VGGEGRGRGRKVEGDGGKGGDVLFFPEPTWQPYD